MYLYVLQATVIFILNPQRTSMGTCFALHALANS